MRALKTSARTGRNRCDGQGHDVCDFLKPQARGNYTHHLGEIRWNRCACLGPRHEKRGNKKGNHLLCELPPEAVEIIECLVLRRRYFHTRLMPPSFTRACQQWKSTTIKPRDNVEYFLRTLARHHR